MIDERGDYQSQPGRDEASGDRLHAGLFYFKSDISQYHEGRDHLETAIDMMEREKEIRLSF